MSFLTQRALIVPIFSLFCALTLPPLTLAQGTRPKVTQTYDNSEDVTRLEISHCLLSGDDVFSQYPSGVPKQAAAQVDALYILIVSKYAGKVSPVPQSVRLILQSLFSTMRFGKDPELSFIIDGKQLQIGKMERGAENTDFNRDYGIVLESLGVTVSFEDLNRIASGSAVSGKIGSREFVVKPDYLSALRSFIGQMRATKVDAAAFATAAGCFHKLVNAIDLGVSLVEYRRLLLDTKTDFDDAVTLLPISAQRTYLEEAMRDYIIAADVWQVGVESRYGIIATKSSLIYSVDKRYELGLAKLKQSSIPYEPLLHMIWEFAAQRIQHATSLQK